eukprot:scaffold142999_cov33-Tisochrysis_lutea.AAC.1
MARVAPMTDEYGSSAIHGLLSTNLLSSQCVILPLSSAATLFMSRERDRFESKHASPRCVLPQKEKAKPMAVVAYGALRKVSVSSPTTSSSCTIAKSRVPLRRRRRASATAAGRYTVMAWSYMSACHRRWRESRAVPAPLNTEAVRRRMYVSAPSH